MKILVTGGAGFMGSAFIRQILANHKDDVVVNLDKLTYAGNLDNLKEVANDPRYKFVKGDIADERLVNQLVGEGIDAIVNYAAETHVDRSISSPKDFVVTDVLGTFTLLEAARHNNIDRYIQISTDEVFGSTESGKFYEESPFKPSSPYSASKAGADLLCGAYVKTFHLPIVVTHSCNVYGPYQYLEKLIPLAITNVLQGKKIPVYGEGQQTREWIYVDDHARAIDFILRQEDIADVYNIGSGEEATNLELVKRLLGLLGQEDDFLEFVKDRPGHDWRYAVDSERLRESGFKTKVGLDAGLKQTVKWYQDNSWWWNKIKSGEYLEYYQKQYGVR